MLKRKLTFWDKAFAVFMLFGFLAACFYAKDIRQAVKHEFFLIEYNKAVSLNAATKDKLRLAGIYLAGTFLEKPDMNAAKMWYMIAAIEGSRSAESALCDSFNICPEPIFLLPNYNFMVKK